MKLLYIDHYDSFTYNVIDWLQDGRQAVDIDLVQFDRLQGSLISGHSQPLILSPGPGSPDTARSTLEFCRPLLGRVPILGICLGHQILCRLAGLGTVQSRYPMHGGVKQVYRQPSTNFFGSFPRSFRAMAYHSLVACDRPLSPDWCVGLRCDKGEIQGIEYGTAECVTVGIQFHPESFRSEIGNLVRDHWLKLAQDWQSSNGR